MRLILFSSDNAKKNSPIDEAVSRLFSSRTRITYIPSCSFGCEPYYKMFQEYFRRFGCRKFQLLATDRPVSRKAVKEGLLADAVYLSGGNTYYFLKHLKRSGLLKWVRDYVSDGGMLMGVSAGSIIMTPNIGTAGVPSYDCDHNEEGLTSLSSLGLVPFEFSPHAKFTKRYIAEMRNYSRTSKHLLYCCGDGGGIVVDHSKILLVGPIQAFYAGNIIGRI